MLGGLAGALDLDAAARLPHQPRERRSRHPEAPVGQPVRRLLRLRAGRLLLHHDLDAPSRRRQLALGRLPEPVAQERTRTPNRCRHRFHPASFRELTLLQLVVTRDKTSPKRHERISRDQRDHSVAEGAKSVQPWGTPISHSTNVGLSRGREVGPRDEDPLPGDGVGGPGRERSQICVQVVRAVCSTRPSARTGFSPGVHVARRSSPAVIEPCGVGHNCSAASSNWPLRCPSRAEPLWSFAPGVGQLST